MGLGVTMASTLCLATIGSLAEQAAPRGLARDIEHGPSGTWLGAVGRARRESTCDAGGVQPRGRGHGEQLAQRGCQSLQGIEAIVTPSPTEAPRLLHQVGVVHEQRMNHDSSVIRGERR